MKPTFYQNRVLYVLITVLISVQIGAFIIQVINHRRISEQTLTHELNVGHRVVQQILSYRNLQLLQVATLLAKDYGFLEAFSTADQDQETIESVLENHRSRAGAGLILLSSLDHKLIAKSPGDLLLPVGRDLTELLCVPKDVQALQFSSLELQHTSKNHWRLFHITHSKLSAPTHIANLTVGYEVDHVFLQHLREMTNLELMVTSKVHNQWVLNASTVPDVSLKELISVIEASPKQAFKKIQQGDAELLILPTKIFSTKNQTTYLVIAKPTAPSLAPFKNIECVLYYLLAVSIFVSVATIYYVTKRFVEPLSREVHTDNLTGIGNRRLFVLMMDRAISHFKTSKTPFLLMMLDLNKFKEINDQYGHDAGDLVLQQVASRIKHAVRASDTVARLGGDEYAIILENCTQEDAIKIVDAISDAIKQPITHRSIQLSVNASIGVTDAHQGDSIDTMIKRADEAMYEAKTAYIDYSIKSLSGSPYIT